MKYFSCVFKNIALYCIMAILSTILNQYLKFIGMDANYCNNMDMLMCISTSIYITGKILYELINQKD